MNMAEQAEYLELVEEKRFRANSENYLDPITALNQETKDENKEPTNYYYLDENDANIYQEIEDCHGSHDLDPSKLSVELKVLEQAKIEESEISYLPVKHPLIPTFLQQIRDQARSKIHTLLLDTLSYSAALYQYNYLL